MAMDWSSLISLDYQPQQQPDMSTWQFDLATPQQVSDLYSPTIDPIDLSTGFQQNVPWWNNYFANPAAPSFSAPSFNPASVGPPPSGGPTPAPMGQPTSMISPSTPPPMGSSTATASTAPGQTLAPRREQASAAPGTTGAAGAGPKLPAYQPGSASKPAPTGGGTPPQRGGFNWQGLLGNVAGAGTQALVGGGLSLLGQALAPRPESRGSAPTPAAPAAPRPTPPPTTPTGTPNMGTTPPLPGAQWSPLLMKQPIGRVQADKGLNLEEETKKRMKKGGTTGGMAMY